jgi:hypothetical protein
MNALSVSSSAYENVLDRVAIPKLVDCISGFMECKDSKNEPQNVNW